MSITPTFLGCNAAVLMVLIILTGGRPSPVVPVTVEPAPMTFAERERAFDDLKAVAVPLPVVDAGPRVVQTVRVIPVTQPEREVTLLTGKGTNPAEMPIEKVTLPAQVAEPMPVPRSIRKARANLDVCQRVGRKKVMTSRYRWKCR